MDGRMGGKALEALSMGAGLSIASYAMTKVCNYTNCDDDERNHGFMGQPFIQLTYFSHSCLLNIGKRNT